METVREPATVPQAPMERLLYEVKKVIVGQDGLLERMLVALLARGHLLVEGVPGLAKTMAIRTLAQAIGGQFQRIQFTSDLVPADVVGTRIYNQRAGEFQVSLGPVFTNLLLADEINRAPAKVQSALLEVMQERQVTIGRESYPAPDPFLVMATQNPIDRKSTCLNSSHANISYAVFCLKKKTQILLELSYILTTCMKPSVSAQTSTKHPVIERPMLTTLI